MVLSFTFLTHILIFQSLNFLLLSLAFVFLRPYCRLLSQSSSLNY
uniref:Uncharacterized protein n=1 Tax=Rhizophora mucronata TaxID=61149 RepID=A0A2P2P650_RHIMU